MSRLLGTDWVQVGDVAAIAGLAAAFLLSRRAYHRADRSWKLVELQFAMAEVRRGRQEMACCPHCPCCVLPVCEGRFWEHFPPLPAGSCPCQAASRRRL